MTQEKNNEISKYIKLILLFADGKIGADQFVDRYMDLFKNENQIFENSIYQVLNNLFIDIDAYCPNPEIRDACDLNEVELLASAKYAITQLRG